MPKPVDANTASPGERRALYQVYARKHDGGTFKIGPPSKIEFAGQWVEIARLGLGASVSCFWIEKLGDVGLSIETGIDARARETLVVGQLPERLEPGRRGVVDLASRVCAGLRHPVTPEEIEKRIIRDIEKWIVFCLWAIGGGFIGVSGYVLFVVE